MRITVDLPDDIFTSPKPAEQVAQEILQAAAMFWLVRGEISAEEAQRIARGQGRGEGPPAVAAPVLPEMSEDEAFEMQRLGGTGFDR